MLRPTATLLAFAVALCVSSAEGAGKRRIAVLQPDAELLRAISIALSAWGVDTTRSEAPLPGASQPEAVQTASQLATRLEVEALVWVTRTERGSLLWVFDNRGDVTTRALAETTPFDSAGAAAVALSVKTILRGSVVAPPEERLQAPAAIVPAVHVVATEIGAGARWFADSEVDFRIGLSLLWHAPMRGLGANLELSWGPGVRIEDSGYRGRYREFVAGAKARVGLFDFGRVSAIVALGGALHWASLEGTLAANANASSVNRLNGSLDLQASVRLRVTPGTYLGASVGADYLLVHQRYLVEGRPIFSPWPLSASSAGYYGVELF
jgi:hypothetical protein